MFPVSSVVILTPHHRAWYQDIKLTIPSGLTKSDGWASTDLPHQYPIDGDRTPPNWNLLALNRFQ